MCDKALLEGLKDSSSPKRRAAAKKIRKSKDPNYGPYLIECLKTEMNDKRTWETQYHLIMAIGESKYKEALPIIDELSNESYYHSMVSVALGDTYIRLLDNIEIISETILSNIISERLEYLEGNLRAIALLHLALPEKTVNKIINYCQTKNEFSLDFWTAAASAGWEEKSTTTFLQRCLNSDNEDLISAANLATKRKYKKWSIL